MNKIFFLICILMISFSVMAGQAMYINENGGALSWNHSASNPILIHPEAGTCASYPNADMLTLLTENLQEWSDLEAVDLTFTVVSSSDGGISVDINADNYADYFSLLNGITSDQSEANAQDGLNPVAFDNDGTLMDAVMGTNGRYWYLGFSGAVGIEDESGTLSLLGTCADCTIITDSQSVFNCYCLETSPGSGIPQNLDCCMDTDGDGDYGTDDCGDADDDVFAADDLDLTMVHELGHALNLDHSATNNVLAIDGVSSNDNDVPTMYPIATTSAVQMTPTEDDRVALAWLYPGTSFFAAGDSVSTTCLVTGTLVDRYGEALRCANIDATTNDYSYNVSVVTGAYAPNRDYNADGDTADYDAENGDECLSDCGDFSLYLRPGYSYQLRVSTIDETFVAGSGLSPCVNGQLPTCTSDLVEACDDDPASDGCEACVAHDLLASVSTDCVAGATISLGTLTTNSISLAYVLPAQAETGSSEESGGCAIASMARSSTQLVQGSIALMVIFVSSISLMRRRRKK